MANESSSKFITSNWSWKHFCGHGDEIKPWSGHDFGHCFEQVGILTPCHIILTVISAYHFGRRRLNLRGSRVYVSWTWFLILRFCSVLLLLVIPSLQIVFTLVLEHIRPSLADALVTSVSTIAWLFHALFVWNIRYLHNSSMRGPPSAVLSFLLVVASNAVHFHTVIMRLLSDSVHKSDTEEMTTFITTGLCLVYLVSLIPSKRRIYHTITGSFNAINSSSDETDPLTWRRFHGYGTCDNQTHSYTAEENVGCLSWLSFSWVNQLMAKGADLNIRSVNDLFNLPKRLKVENLEQKFLATLRNIEHKKRHLEPGTNAHGEDTPSVEVISPNSPLINSSPQTSRHTYQSISDCLHSSGEETPHRNSQAYQKINLQTRLSLPRALYSTFGLEYFSLGILKLLADCFGFAGPILLNLLVTFIESHSEKLYKGYVYASALFLSTLFAALCSTQFSYNVQVVAYKVRCAMITSVYRKSLHVNSIRQAKFTPGEIVNFMSTDVDRILNFCPSFHAFWSLPFQIGVSLFLLYQQVGLAFLAGVAFAVLLIPINRKIAVKIGELSKDMMRHKDERVKLMNELLYGIRVVKFYSWEEHFKGCIDSARKKELKCLKGRKYLDALCVFFWATTPVLISILTFTTYVLMGNQLTASKVFTSLSLFLMLIGPLNAFPWVINGLVEAWVSLRRVEEFVNLKDSNLRQHYTDIHDSDESMPLLKMESANFTWHCPDDHLGSVDRQDSEDSDLSDSGLNAVGDNHSQGLMDIDLTVHQGQFIGIIGKVGSGKSSLLSAIVNDMDRISGDISLSEHELREGFALVAQESWIQHSTIRDNILFGQPFDGPKYDRVVEACALLDDLKAMPAGDRTEVGENGITLSGGQRARIALARAVYQDKNTYLLDDPYAAVDTHVAQHIHAHCIMGLLKHKTRILSTHHVHYLSSADYVVEMKDGSIISAGPPEEIIAEAHLQEERRHDKARHIEERAGAGGSSTEDGEEMEDDLVQEEERQTGVVKADVYKNYWLSVGSCLAPCVLVSLFLMQASRNVSDWWLAYWVSHTHKGEHSNDSSNPSIFVSAPLFNIPVTNLTDSEDNLRFYLGVYGGLAAANSLFTLFRAFLFAYGGICAARVVHKGLLAAILKAPISFFDSTPIGRILNRFSSDLYAVDDSLPFILNIFLAQAYGILGTLVVTCYGLPWFLVCLVPLGAIYYRIQHYYRHTSRELKRLSSVTLSPIYAHFSETIVGLSTIKAMRHTERFSEENRRRLDINLRAQYATQLATRWLDFRLSMLGVAIVACISYIAVVQHQLSTVDAGLVGLAISYALSVTNLLSGVVMSFTETEKEFVSMERCQHYISETPTETWEGNLFPPTMWPSEGVIEYDNVYLRYREATNYALGGISFKTKPGEKVGVVGRTGAGKSSLFLSLFRLVELCEGRILVDDVDIKHLDLGDIRSKFAIIPQDPFLFSGTIRMNLDPTSAYSDSDLWSSLERCYLRSCVERMGGLEATVSHRGKEFSVGQRQLVCLARAVLTKAKVLCIDEATASVDLETDGLIQNTIRHEFRDSTVLTIAHRINTVMDSHRVLVLKDGVVAEFATPDDLLADSTSLFYRMVYGTSYNI